jgi:hypothetical protein
VVAGCDPREREPVPASVARSSSAVPLSAETGVILPESSGPALLEQCTRSGPSGVRGYWSPDSSAIRDIEVRLPVLLDSVFDLVYRPADKRLAIPGYRRQYIGITKWTGERAVYVSAFHELEQSLRSGADTLQWRRTPVSRCDGGLMYFGVEYDPAKRRFGRLHFNHRSTGAIRY